jgi:hypothetical protein
MSVMINGIDMPKNCLLCPCCASEGTGMGRQHYCQAIDDEPYVRGNYRPENCPLTEIPTPHGDLIDRGELVSKLIPIKDAQSRIGQTFMESLIALIKEKPPTIIEAEQGDG